MSIFREHKVQLVELLRIISEESFSKLAIETQVDHYAKVLKGKTLFCLLLYALLRDDRLGQRGIADLYASPIFSALFNLPQGQKKLAHSSVSERLSKVPAAYFEQLYAAMHKRYSQLYPAQTLAGLRLQRVDSSLVADVSHRMKEGLAWGNEKHKGKMLKYTMSYDGMYGSFAKVHSEDKYASESVALPENVLEHFKKSKDLASVYIFDRGQSSTQAFARMQADKELHFVGRLVENRKLVIQKELSLTYKRFRCGHLKQDAIVQLYGYEHGTSKSGKAVKRQLVAKEKYRVIRFRPAGKEEDMLLLTNMFTVRAEAIALMYRRRWDIEVFFRFLKQEVSFSHFLSLNQNGITVILYMTLIAAMMIMIYKKENAVGFKTAKRRMLIEMEAIVMAITALAMGGNEEDLQRLGVSSP
jgi:hypothetical protein